MRRLLWIVIVLAAIGVIVMMVIAPTWDIRTMDRRTLGAPGAPQN